MELDNQTCLNHLRDIYTNYGSFHELKLPLEDKIKSQFLNNLKVNNIKYIGAVPIYTLYNVQKTKEEILKIDEDSIIGIIGKAGKGKTSVSFIVSFLLDKDFKGSRVIFTFEELLEFLLLCSVELDKEAEGSSYSSYLRGSNIVVDEGVYIFFSADVNSKQGKLATKLLTVIRFLNLIVFVNATNYEKLNKLLRDSRLRLIIRIDGKGFLSFFSPKKTELINVDADNEVIWQEPSFSEEVGYLSKDNAFWRSYQSRKSQFTSNMIKDIISEVKSK